MSCWVPVPEGSDFPIENLPYGTFSVRGASPALGVAIGNAVLDVSAAGRGGLLPASTAPATTSLDRLLAAGRPIWAAVRQRIGELLTDPAAEDRVRPLLHSRKTARLHLPFTMGDYVDFYSSLEHATNLGRLFRPGSEPLLPNWRHLPVGYHGRGGTVVVSGTPIRRPYGQRKPPEATDPVFGPTERLDVEAEVGFVIGTPSRLGEPVPAQDAAEHVFGLVLVNDWSARDVQAWEYQPLGPFLGKSFATTISPWVVPLDALAGARVPAPPQSPEPLPYLRYAGDWGFDLTLAVSLNDTEISRPPYAGMYWTIPQQLAHATVNGASVRTGDLFASGTISGAEPDELGSLIELTAGGSQPLTLDSGERRTFLLNGDVVTIRATTGRGPRLGFGDCVGEITPPAP